MKVEPMKTSVAKTAVNKVKKAPQKIIEKTVDKAIATVEKAAVNQEKRTKKVFDKKIKKAVKTAQKKAIIAEKEKNTTKKSKAQKLKTEIKQILTRTTKETFYYSSKALIKLTALYAFISIIVYKLVNCIANRGLLENNALLSTLTILLTLLTVLALGSAVFVMLFPQPLAEITKKTIKIDHNAPINWSDVKEAQEIYTSKISKRKIITLTLKEGATYPLTFMQKLCRHNIYTPHSLPLYAMDEKDAENLRKLIKKHTKYHNLTL